MKQFLTSSRRKTLQIDIYTHNNCESSNNFIVNQLTWIMKKEKSTYYNMTIHPVGGVSLSINNDLICSSGLLTCQLNMVLSCVNHLYIDPKIRWSVTRCVISYNRYIFENLELCTDGSNVLFNDIYTCVHSGQGEKLLKEEIRQASVVLPSLLSQDKIRYPATFLEGKLMSRHEVFYSELCASFATPPSWCLRIPPLLLKSSYCSL
ncbi:hypothetical protein WA158_002243 [Blastocystis sp. Blastoise]